MYVTFGAGGRDAHHLGRDVEPDDDAREIGERDRRHARPARDVERAFDVDVGPAPADERRAGAPTCGDGGTDDRGA